MGQLCAGTEIVEREITVEREIALCSLQNTSVWHNPSVAHSTRQDPNLDFTFFLHHIAEVRQRAISGDQRASHLQKLRITNVQIGGFRSSNSSIAYRFVKDLFTGLYPVGVCFERWCMTFVIPIDDRVLMFERFKVASWFVTRGIYGVALIYGPDRYPVVVVGGNLLGRPHRIGQRDFECGHLGIIPSLGNRRFSSFGTWRLRMDDAHPDSRKEKNENKQPA